MTEKPAENRIGAQTGDQEKTGRWRVLFLLAAGLLAVLPYLGILDAPYVFDDVKLVRDNKELGSTGPGTIRDIAGSFDVTSRQWSQEGLRANYRPLRFLSYRLDYFLSTVFFSETKFNPGTDPPPVLFFHLQNIFWHALNAMLVFLLCRFLLGSDAGALIAALLFALHPVQTESVTYISSRRDVLSTFFFLACLVVYLRVPREEGPGWGTLLLGPVLFSLGLLAKEMVITLPAVLLLVDLVRRPALMPRRWVFHALLWVVAVVSIVITLNTPGLVASAGESRGLTVIYDAARYVARYLGLVLLPLSQSIDYSYAAISESKGLLDPLTTLYSLSLVLALVLVSFWSYRKGMGLPGLAILWFLGTLVPVLQFVPIAERFAEHFAYLPSIGIALLAGWLLSWVLNRSHRLGWTIGLCLALTCFYMTVRRNDEWSSRESLYAAAVREQPRCARARFEYGNALVEKNVGSPEALVQFDSALAIWQEQPLEKYLGYKLIIHAQRGLVYSELGEKNPESLAKAIEELRFLFSQKDSDGSELAVSTKPVLLKLRLELASCLERAGKEEDALSEYRKIIKLDSVSTMALRARFKIYQVLFKRKDIDGAVSVLEEIPALVKRGSADWLNAKLFLFFVLLEYKKDLGSAEALIEDMYRSAVNDEQKVGFLLRWAQVFDRKGNLDACVAKLEEALHIDPVSKLVLESIAPIESKRNQTKKAEGYFLRLLRVSPGNPIARQGLKEIGVREDAGPVRGAKEKEAKEMLVSMEESARAHEGKKQWTAALQSWKQIVKTASETASTDQLAVGYRGMARCEVKFGLHKEATRDLEKALETGATVDRTYRALADLHLRYLKKPDAAAEYYRRHLETLAPGSRADAGVYLNLARLLASGAREESIGYYEKAVEEGIFDILGANSAGVKKDMGLLYVKLGRWKEAADSLSEYHESLGAGEEEERLVIEEILNEHVLPKKLEEENKKDGGK